jgi:lysophospholipase L1-like esterase
MSPSRRRSPQSVALFLPYGESVEIIGIDLPARADLQSPEATGTKPAWHAFGDSITQGYYASSAYHSYPHHVARLRGWEAYNWGVGGRCIEPDDAARLGPHRPAIVTVLLGFNDFHQQRSLDRVEQAIASYLTTLRSCCGKDTPICVITPLWSAHQPPAGGIPLASYRAAILHAASLTADRRISVIDGLRLVPGRQRYFPDGIHPNDAGFTLLSRSLAILLPSPAATSQ